MDKDTFNKQAIADPDSRETEFLREQNGGDENRAQVERHRRDDAAIKSAMQVDVPEGLAGRILLHQSLQEEQQRRQWFKNVYAVAASVLLAVVILAVVIPKTPSLDEAVLTHIYNELDHLSENRNVADSVLNHLLQSFGGQFVDSIGEVSYAGLCNIRKGPGMHLVLQSEQGPVTVLIMPEEKLDQRLSLGDERFSGVLLPATTGSIAVIGEDDAAISAIEILMQNAISWSG